MVVFRWIGRGIGLTLAIVALAVGGLSLALDLQPEHTAVEATGNFVAGALKLAAGIEALGLPEDLSERFFAASSGVLFRYAMAPLGLILLIWVLLPGSGQPLSEEQDFDLDDGLAAVDPRALKKAKKDAKAIARKGMTFEAAELCFAVGLFDEAAAYFVKAEEYVRAAEIRHDQDRFIEAAELYFKAESYEAAAVIFSQQEEYARAAEAYVLAESESVAAEMFEQAGQHQRAAECYEKAGFPRHAAQAYVKCDRWENAARCLEEVLLEEMSGVGATDSRREAEAKKMVRMAGTLYERAGKLDAAEAVLVKGEIYDLAAEVALKCERLERAAELFLKAKDVTRAAEVMRRSGEVEGAARVLADYHRDRGEHAEAARCFEEAGEYLEAGDLYRLMECYDQAGACYERFGEAAQAAEMFRINGDRTRAAENYERAELYSEAAECYALAGENQREAELLAKAGAYLRAGEIHLEHERQDEAVAALQQLQPGDEDFVSACALLGEIFRERKQYSLVISKLKDTFGDCEITRENVRACFCLATVYEENGDIAEAAALYERILAFDYTYADTERRLAMAREILATREGTASSTADTGMPTASQDGRYVITGTLGRGGMGIVYKANDTVLDRTVAFKVLPESLKENPQALKNFLREAKSAAQLNHPGIVTIYDAGEQDGVFYIAMEYVDGNTLKEIVKRKGPVAARGIVSVLAQMAEALAYAHENKIVHRDIKTANTMWTRDRKAKIMDFGLAKVVEEVRNHTTVVSGTPYYMSPEQTLGKNVDYRTDIYSLGVTLFELATATLPFTEGNLPYHHVHTPPPDVRALNAEVPDWLAQIVARCLRKKPSERYQSAREILAELRANWTG